LVQDIEDKNKIVKFFVNEVIYHETDLGVDRGWPSLQGIDINTHINYVHNRLDALNTAKANNLYTNTEGYRSRASSGAIEDIKAGIISPAIDFIRKNFGLEEDRIKELETQLGGLNLGVDEGAFRQEAIDKVKEYCLDDRIATTKMTQLEKLILPSTAKAIGENII